MPQTDPNFPVREAMLDTNGLLRLPWIVWFRNLFSSVGNRPNVLSTVTESSQTASIAATPFDTESLSEGQYQVNAFLHVLVPAGVASAISVAVNFTHKGNACALSSTALATNLNTSVQGTPFVFDIDAATPVSWSTTYASNPVNAMQYYVSMTLIAVSTTT